MTQDYKDNLLKYLTGNLDIESGQNYPVFDENIETLNKNIYYNIKNILNNPSSLYILGKIYNSNYDNYLIYGYYAATNESPRYGYIYLVDGDLNEIQMITEFDSGTKLFPITALNQAEDSNIYGLSGDDSASPKISRVLLLNNIFASGLTTGNYKAILRNSYIVPYNYNQSLYRQNRIIKSPDSSVYYMVFRDAENVKTKIVRFTINVGAENEWIEAELPYSFSTSKFDLKLDKSSGEEILHYYAISSDNPAIYRDYIINGDTATINKSITLPYQAKHLISQVFVKDINNIYLYVAYMHEGLNVIYKIVGDELKTIYQIYSQQSPTDYYGTTVVLFEVNNGLFFFEKYRDYPNYNISVGYISDDDSYIKYFIDTSTGAIPTSSYDYVDFYFKSLYNLVNLYAPIYSDINTTKKITIDYNSINYNGEGYTNINSLVPNKARLYDDNNKMIFARNLYNKVINANTTISTLNIPNTNLNNIIIYNQSLIGETNYVLMNNQEEITKNIYENLNINFYATLRMINNNDPNNQIFNQVGSNRINLSVSSVKDYNNAKATKIRINYSDNTTKISSIEFYPIQNYYYTKFSIYIDKLISSIDFISNDEETIYNTIRPNFIVGKYYTINQSVRIDDRIQTQPVLYNNEQLYYNNEEVYY